MTARREPRIDVRFQHVALTHVDAPDVRAFADGFHVLLTRRGWTCDCPKRDCAHVTAVQKLLDPRLLRLALGYQLR